MGDVFTTTAIITGTEIRVQTRGQYTGHVEVAFTEARPASLADADMVLALHSLRRVLDWDLGADGTVQARVALVDNRFGGTVAARIEGHLGSTHEELSICFVGNLEPGDLISSAPSGEPVYVVAGCSTEMGETKIHMVGEGQTWEERYTASWPAGSVVWGAHKRV